MDKANKYYKKALIKYHKGYIDDAINYCGASISENKKFKAALSLKGVLYYFKGDLESARELWDFNVRVNKDVVSKKYIENTKNDDELLSIFAEAVHLTEKVKINDALRLLKSCEVSDFNVINVSNYTALCLIKQGEYDKAWVYLEKVLNIDKKNKMALDNIKMLREYGIIEKKYNFNPIIASLIALLMLGSGLTIYRNHINKKPSKKAVVSVEKKKPAENTPKTTVQPPAEQTPASPQTKTEEKFPFDKINKELSSLDYDNMYADLIKWKDKNLNSNEKALLDSVNSELKSQGSEYFYTQGRQLSKDNNYKTALEYYYKVYFLGQGDFYEHGLFYLASSSEEVGNKNDAIKYYQEYSTAFPSGSYEDTVLYNLSMIYKDIDISKAKKYAEMLSDNFSDSEYINSNIKEILSK